MQHVNSSSLRWDGGYLSPLPLSSQEPDFNKSMDSFGKTVLILCYYFCKVYLFLVFCSTVRLSLYTTLAVLTMTTLCILPRPSKSSYVSLLGTSSAFNFISHSGRSEGTTQNSQDKFRIESCKMENVCNSIFVLNLWSVRHCLRSWKCQKQLIQMKDWQVSCTWTSCRKRPSDLGVSQCWRWQSSHGATAPRANRK